MCVVPTNTSVSFPLVSRKRSFTASRGPMKKGRVSTILPHSSFCSVLLTVAPPSCPVLAGGDSVCCERRLDTQAAATQIKSIIHIFSQMVLLQVCRCHWLQNQSGFAPLLSAAGGMASPPVSGSSSFSNSALEGKHHAHRLPTCTLRILRDNFVLVLTGVR